MDASLLAAVILGIVEGVTEFLPVSSTGHLILADAALGFASPPGAVFEVVIQVGAILAVCWAYRARLWAVAEGLPTRPEARRFAAKLIVAFLPAAVVGAPAHHAITTRLFSPWVVAVSLIVGGVAILLIERHVARRPRVETTTDVDSIDFRSALGIGLGQILALVPGVSRAGATIIGGVAIGVDRRAATEFSFFLAIPTMFGAAAYGLYKNGAAMGAHDALLIGIGLLTSFLCALVVVRWLIRFVGHHGFAPFGWYRIALGLAVLALIARHSALPS